MGATCELRRLSAADAQYFRQNPLVLARRVRAEADRHYADLQRLGYAARQATVTPDPNVRYYDWLVLVAQTAGSPEARRILVEESQEVGGLAEQYLMEGEARLLFPAQVQALHAALQSAAGPAELYHAQPAAVIGQLQQLREELNRFLQATAEQQQALLLLLAP